MPRVGRDAGVGRDADDHMMLMLMLMFMLLFMLLIRYSTTAARRPMRTVICDAYNSARQESSMIPK